MIVNDIFESSYAGNTERAIARNIAGNEQGVAEGQLNEYLTQEGGSFTDILGLNLFMDMGPDGVDIMDRSLVKKYKPIANQLARLIQAQKKRRLTYDESDMIDNVWYDGSDAYDDMEVEFLADLYDQQIEVVTDILENRQGVAEGFSAMLANATSRADLKQIRNFVTENVHNKDIQREIMEQATRIVAVQRRKYAARAAK